MIDQYLNVKEVALALGISVPTVWRRVNSGDLPKPVKLGRATRWPASDIAAAMDRLKSLRDGEAA